MAKYARHKTFPNLILAIGLNWLKGKSQNGRDSRSIESYRPRQASKLASGVDCIRSVKSAWRSSLELAYCDPHTKLVGRSGSPFGARNVGQNKTGTAFFFLKLNNLLLAEIVFGFNLEPTADEFNSLTHALAQSARRLTGDVRCSWLARDLRILR